MPRTKWWLWIPLGLLAMFIGYGLTIPEYRHVAREKRKVCEALVGPFRKDECWRKYYQDLAIGKANDGNLSKGYQAPVDRSLAEATEKARAEEEATMLLACKKDILARKAEYQRLMNSREYWSASLALRRCSELLEDTSLKLLVADAERKQYVMEIEAPGTSREARNQAIEALLRDYPEVGKKYEKQLKR